MVSLGTDRNAVADIFNSSPFVYLHCVESDSLKIPMSNFSSLFVKVRVCHISQPDNVGKRKCVLIADCDEWSSDLITHFDVPRFIKVKSSCNTQVC